MPAQLPVVPAQLGHRSGALSPPQASRGRVDPMELGALGVFALISLWILGLDLWQVIVHGRVWTGTDGIYIVDQMQYLSWIRDASHHVLAANLFVLRGTPADYLQPGVILSALLTRLGVAPWLALILWKPVAVLCTFVAFRAYVHDSLGDRPGRRIALVLALFYGSFSIVYGSFSVVGDLMPTFLSWGYSFGLLAIGLMAGALVAYARAREHGRARWLPGLLGGAAALLHPWQAELLIVIVVGSELVMWRLERRRTTLRLPALTLVLSGVPLLYYEVLGRTDLSWELARQAGKHNFSLWTILLFIAPLAVPAAFGLRLRPRTFLAVITRAWLVCAMVVWALSQTALSAAPLHAFEGITLPLAVLAVQGVAGLRSQYRLPAPRVLIAAALVLVTVPALVFLMSQGRDLVSPAPGNPNFITSQERSALRYLARNPEPGGVLTRFYLGTVVPAETGRRTFVGDCLWSEPNCSARAITAQSLLDGTLPIAQARAFVRSSGAHFVLSDCQEPMDLTRTLAPMLVSVRRFGCATVYELAAPAAPTGPLAESGQDAALRASWRQ